MNFLNDPPGKPARVVCFCGDNAILKAEAVTTVLRTVEGIYNEGRVELLEKPVGVGRARLIVTFLEEQKTEAPRYMKQGQFPELRAVTEDDFKAAEWHGELEVFPED